MREGDERNSASVSHQARKQVRIAEHFERGVDFPGDVRLMSRSVILRSSYFPAQN
jgi:hypothetical protein